MNSGLGILIVFVIIIIGLNITKKLYFAIIFGVLGTVLLFRIPGLEALSIFGKTITSWDTIEMVLILYVITYLQRMMEKNGSMIMAQKSIDALINNRRVNTMLSPMIIGLLPSAAVVKLCGDIVDQSAGEYLTTEEKSFVASYYRHVCESFMPTYTSILIGTALSGVAMSSFVLGMLPMVAAQIFAGYIVYLRKMPKDTGVPSSTNRRRDLGIILKGLWPLFLIIILILGSAATPFPIKTLWAVLISVVLYVLINRFPPSTLLPMFKTAFEPKLLVNMFLIYVFKNMISYTGAIEGLPSLFAGLPIPQFLIYALIFLVGSVIGGAQMITAIGIPLAYAAMPDGGMPLLVLLSCCSYMAMQVSPTHVCLEVVVEHFGISMGAQVKKTLPVIGIFFVLSIIYYLIIRMIF